MPDWKIDAERVALLRGTDTVFTFLAPFLAGNSSATLTSPGVGSSYSGSQEIEEVNLGIAASMQVLPPSWKNLLRPCMVAKGDCEEESIISVEILG